MFVKIILALANALIHAFKGHIDSMPETTSKDIYEAAISVLEAVTEAISNPPTEAELVSPVVGNNKP